MDIKSNFAILTEMASIDNSINTRSKVELDAVKEAYETIPTAESYVVTEAADVIVNNINGSYYVEMVNLSPFMQDAGLTSIAKALDLVAEANNMEPKSIGLVVESQGMINAILANADAKSKSTGNHKIRENAITKVQKDVAIVNKLLNEGYKVAKKGDKDKGNKVCKNCGKAECKCECGGSCGKGSKKECDASGSTAGKAVIAECDDKGKPVKEQYSMLDRIAEGGIIEAVYGDLDLDSLTEAQIVQIIQEKAELTKEEIDKKLKVLDSGNPTCNDVYSFFMQNLGLLGTSVAGLAGSHAVAKGITKAGVRFKTVAGAGAAGYAIGFGITSLVFLAVNCLTRILHCAGSISDQLLYAKKIKKEFDKAIKKFEESGDEKMVKKCKDAKAKVEKKLAEIEKSAEGKSKLYQNYHDTKGNNLSYGQNADKKH